LFSAYGFTFVGCTLEADPGVGNITLAGANGTTGGLDAWVNCLIATNAYVSPSVALSNTYVFWQNNNKAITGTSSISFTNVQTIGLTNNDPRLLAATNPVVWFSGWSPTLPNGFNPPTLTPVPNQTINVGVTLNVTNVATDPDVPPQTLTFSLLTGPTNAVVDPGTGVFTWRPLVSQASTINPIAVVVTDNSPINLSATNNFTVTVNALNQANVTSISSSGGQFTLTVTADVGPDYAIQTSTNLVDWQTLFITNSPPSPFSYTDTNPVPVLFYRIKAGPPLP